jgi:type IV pilus assembly protein PilV
VRSSCTGFTLIEVLIAVLVLAIGLLALAGVQTISLRSNHVADLHSQATQLAYDLIDRIRANRAGFQAGYYDYDNPTATDNHCAWDGTTPSLCTTEQMAQHDLWEWNATVASALPQGVGLVCKDSTPDDGGDADGDGSVATGEMACDDTGGQYVVKLWWAEREDGGSLVFKRFATPFQP